jgi:hypothetical protein
VRRREVDVLSGVDVQPASGRVCSGPFSARVLCPPVRAGAHSSHAARADAMSERLKRQPPSPQSPMSLKLHWCGAVLAFG